MRDIARLPIPRRLQAFRFDLRSRQRLYRDLSALMKAGLSKGEALDAIAAIATGGGRQRSRVLARILADARAGMRSGNSLAASLAGWIPASDRMVLEAIEASDSFPRHLETFSRNLHLRAAARGQIIGELAYPILLLCMVYGLLVFFHIRIAPVLGDLLPRSQWIGAASHLDHASRWAAANIIPVAVTAALSAPAMALLLRHWAGRGRATADQLPIFAEYRAQTGIAFLKSIGAMMSSGMSAVEAISRIRPGVCPYVGRRLDLVRYNLLNGHDLGAAIELAGSGWPDRDLVLSLQVLANLPDFPTRLSEIAEDWLHESHERLLANLGKLRAAAFLIVFAVISAFILAMHAIQNQIALSLH